MAGITPADVDVLEPYDSFTITVLLALKTLASVKREREVLSLREAGWRLVARFRL